MSQRIKDQEVQQDWAIEQAQENAMRLHHDQMAQAPSRSGCGLPGLQEQRTKQHWQTTLLQAERRLSTCQALAACCLAHHWR